MIKTILCPITGIASDRPALDAAAELARRFLAHVDVLHAKPDAADLAPYLGEGMSPMLINQIVESAERRAEEQAASARAMFDGWSREQALPSMSTPGVTAAGSCAWLPASGAQDRWIATHGRLADLTVVGTPGEDAGVAATLAFEAALLDTGKPVLMVPSRPLAPPGTAVVAWNGSAEAARAVAASLPLLAMASRVHVVTIEEGHRQADPGALARYLAWHRIGAEARLIAGKGVVATTMIDEECARHGATLLVMGGYTHSRLRELIFGGVTAHVIKSASTPVLIAH